MAPKAQRQSPLSCCRNIKQKTKKTFFLSYYMATKKFLAKTKLEGSLKACVLAPNNKVTHLSIK